MQDVTGKLLSTDMSFEGQPKSDTTERLEEMGGETVGMSEHASIENDKMVDTEKGLLLIVPSPDEIDSQRPEPNSIEESLMANALTNAMPIEPANKDPVGLADNAVASTAAIDADTLTSVASSPSDNKVMIEATTPVVVETVVAPPAVNLGLKSNASRTNSKQRQQQAELQSLPLDSLHYVASFLTPLDWCNGFGLINKASHVCASAIVSRARIHAFKCASEVVLAWKAARQWEDARELAALYVQAGVPIYGSRCFGHSFHTLNWRLKVEAAEYMRTATIAADAAATTTSTGQVNTAETGTKKAADAFFGSARAEFRSAEGHGRELTYVEEKCMFWLDRESSSTSSRNGSRPVPTVAPVARRPAAAAGALPLAPVAAAAAEDDMVGPAGAAAAAGQRRSVSPPSLRTVAVPQQQKVPPPAAIRPKIPIHQHLLDRHSLGEYYVNDHDGRMVAPMTVLSADFFHPSSRTRRKSLDIDASNNTSSVDPSSNIATVSEHVEESAEWLDDEVPDPQLHPPSLNNSALAEGDIADLDDEHQPNHPALPVPNSAISGVILEAYSSTMMSSLDDVENVQDVVRHLRSRFATYQRRLEAFLAKGDTCGLEECMLDFWDEFLPHSAGIHYHDLHTPVPRMSCMNKFLTTPCPKAIGVIQCEIERINVTTRGKGGVNVKSRFFPTYEYRLFIRNRPLQPVAASGSGGDPENEEQGDFVRRDTVLMVAKNRGRKHTEPSGGVIPLSAASKKGSNNYYLYVPQQMDVDEHFTKCNEHLSKQARLEPNGANRNPVLVSDAFSGSALLGRLQSNFIGTEFQIFTPKLRKLPRQQKAEVTSHAFGSDDEHDDDSGVSSDTNRRYRFGRFLRSTGTNPGSDSGSVGHLPSASDRPRVMRTTSAPEFSGDFTGRQPRTNRRAIANDALSSATATAAAAAPQPHSALCEEEGGAITYTANLLGSRPRIMDVCVPKVTIEGLSGAEWKRYLESCDDTDDCRMLSCFRQLQQRRENHEAQEANADAESEAEDESDFGLMALQNRPPWWNADLGSFVLNFGGRVSVASVKNFQLCERTNQDLIMLQFGRIKGRHSFTMDFQHPLTAVQAFSIAISSLQSKISFG